MKWRSKKLAALLVAWLALQLAGPSAGLLAQTPELAPEQKAAFQRVSDKLICQCGCHYGLSHCPHLDCPSAPRMREAIRQKLAAGLAEPQILDAMAAEFGVTALAEPPAVGFNRTLPWMVVAAVVLGLLAVVTVIRRWRARPPAPAAADSAALEQYRSAVERELRRFEE